MFLLNLKKNGIVVNVHNYLEYVLNFTAYESIQNIEFVSHL